MRSLNFKGSEPRVREGCEFAAWSNCARRGDLARAWRINEQTGQHWPSAHRLWQGTATMGGVVVVRFLHGLGDAVQMLQYAPVLAGMGVRACFDVPAALVPLLPYFEGANRRQMPGPGEGSLEVEAMELPFLFRTRCEDLPLSRHYLRLPAALVAGVRDQMGPHERPRVGLVWSGSDCGRGRWMPEEYLQGLCARRELDVWNLQQSAEGADGMRHAGTVCGPGLLALAATIANLDVLVTVDTLAAHLAGALGVRAYVLLKHEADWRWMSGDETPWYPSLRLIRQEQPGAWGGVITRLERALMEAVGEAGKTREEVFA